MSMNTVSQLREQLKQQSSELMAAPRMGQQLREDRLIASVRQRLSIPGGCCSFDLPGLHLAAPATGAARYPVNSWLASLDPLRNSLTMILNLIRQSGVFRHQTSLNGFYQDNAEGPTCCACS